MKARRIKKLDPERGLAENAARILDVRIAELRSFAPEALERDGSTAQHDMRIAAKRLRYVLEATGFCFGRPADVVRKRAKQLQDVLGEIHDCDVMLPRIAAHVDELRAEDSAAVRGLAADAEDLDPALTVQAPNRTAYRGLDVLAVHVAARRELLLDRFADLWGRIESDGDLDRLRRAAERKRGEARRRRAEAKRAQREREAAERELRDALAL